MMSLTLGLGTLFLAVYGLTHLLGICSNLLSILVFISIGAAGTIAFLAGIFSFKK